MNDRAKIDFQRAAEKKNEKDIQKHVFGGLLAMSVKSKNNKKPKDFNDFGDFRFVVLSKHSASKIIQKPSKIHPKSVQNRSKNGLQEDIKKVIPKMTKK